MKVPKFLSPYQKEGEDLLKQGFVQDVEFSGRTYQVQVFDPTTGRGHWVFMQLNERGAIVDGFCSCPDKNACAHMVAAYMRLFSVNNEPLHVRFQRSFWNAFCFTYRKAPLIEQKDKTFATEDGSFSIQAKGTVAQEHLKEIITERYEETEETSLKFSNVSPQEIQQWREGNPSEHLNFELSFWGDLAKWLVLMEDEGKSYTLNFSGRIPNQLTLTFPQLIIIATLDEKKLNSIIPTLDTVHASLIVHKREKRGEGTITFDPQSGEMEIHSGEKKQQPEKVGTPVGDWLYVPDDGFYPLQTPTSLADTTLKGKQIEQALNENFAFIEQQLKELPVHRESVPAQYALHFDDDWNLQIQTYVQQPDDLLNPQVHRFGEWVYLPKQGIFHLDQLYFNAFKVTIPKDRVTAFIRNHRIWLNAQAGFHAYVGRVEAQFSSQVDNAGNLTLTAHATLGNNSHRSQDFGSWIYVEGEGFYAKKASTVHLPPEANHPIPKARVEGFIRDNQSELLLVPGFFFDKCPIDKVTVKVALTDKGTISIAPDYGLNIPFVAYGTVLYLERKGFYLLPPEECLPSRFRYSSEILEKDFPHFLTKDLPQLGGDIDPQMKLCHEYKFEIEFLEKSPLGYCFKAQIQTDIGSIPLTDLWYSLHQGHRFHFSEAGCIDGDARELSWLKKIPKSAVDRRKKTLDISAVEFIRMTLVLPVSASGQGKELHESLLTFHSTTKPHTEGMKGSLRHYQEKGLDWLWFLYSHRLSGLLCDDMGLGKTHQVMALIAAIIEQHRQHEESTSHHFLVVCPTSVIYHWEEKLQEYLPHIRVCTYHGLQRSLADFREDYDLLLTSYGIMRREAETLKEIPFELATFDEIQVAKNTSSRTHNALKQVQATMRMGLSGTPIENALPELKALFDLVLPGYMPSEKEYRERFVKPIQNEGNVERRAELTKMVRPFLLRRKKENVLTELPEKTEEIAHCELTEPQKQLYQQVLERTRPLIIPDLENEESAVPYIHIFSLLSQLKQVCNHPAAYHKQPKDYADYSSGKWGLFLELLSEARGSSQKVVVFSQYLAMLDIIETYLNETGISFAKLRGDTVDRAAQIKRFNTDPECEVFVGSLKAAGLGVDLTAGSVVIHYDRWWNAAREDQATDRVHRIGQTRGVQVFKLVTKNTFEERIDTMIAKKGQLMEEVIGVDDHTIVKRFTRQELLNLLESQE